jgi:hypothetical protein
MRKVVRVLLLSLLPLFGLSMGCTKQDQPVGKGTRVQDAHPLKERWSGYAASVQDWEAFLKCWATESTRKATLKGSSPQVSLLSKFTHLSTDPQPSSSEIEAGIARLESRLGIVLPQSYKDFLRAYRPPTYRPHVTHGGGNIRVGVYAVDQVDRLGRLEPQLVQISREFAIESRDANYYVYGVDQDDVAVRTKNREDAIVIGSHGPEIHDLIVMYPQERTRDGEMESSLIFHSGEFRAPSFAELMRQLSYMETHSVKRVPPYSQTDLANSCSSLLPHRDVWWK